MSNEFDISELLAGKALGDLSPEEQQFLDSNMSVQNQHDLVELERTAAAIHLAAQALDWSEGDEDGLPLPLGLQQRISDSAADHFASAESARIATAPTPATQTDVQFAPSTSANTARPFHGREGVAWILVAASLLLALGLWTPSTQPDAPLTAFQVRQNILSTGDVIQASWSDGPTAFQDEVSGDVVWSNNSQQGMMRFIGLPINDPTLSQYQLWIIDPNRDDEPIDGGVFNITSTGEVLIPIDAKLKVVSPKAFAITIEKPGGVVVSTQEKLPLLAMVE